MEKKIEQLKKHITSYPDFPKPGILFRDMFSLLRDPAAFTELTNVMVEYVQTYIPDCQVIVGLESRGFLLGSVLALSLKLPFVPIRKPGKLPGELNRVTYSLEYGSDSFEIQKESIISGQKILLVDDLLATGGSLEAASKLIVNSGGNVCGCLVVMELVELKGRDKIKHDVYSLMEF